MKYYKLHLIRHGLTAGNLQGLYIGSGSDLPLCDEGRAQLKTLVKDFDYPQVPLVFTSPMKRATETAEILFPGVRQIELDDLREMAFGKFEGRAVQELVKRMTGKQPNMSVNPDEVVAMALPSRAACSPATSKASCCWTSRPCPWAWRPWAAS